MLILIIYLFIDGKFGAYMSVNIQNDGPVTVNLDSRTKVSTRYRIISKVIFNYFEEIL